MNGYCVIIDNLFVLFSQALYSFVLLIHFIYQLANFLIIFLGSYQLGVLSLGLLKLPQSLNSSLYFFGLKSSKINRNLTTFVNSDFRSMAHS